MKSFKVKLLLTTKAGSVETIVQAGSSFDVKKIVQAQYGNSLRSIQQISEIR